MERCELLSPAGDKESFIAALDGGADAIYVGLSSFSARRNAANFSFEELKPLIYRAHVMGVKVYIAANTLIKDGEREAFLASLARAGECGADALIMQDLHLAESVRKAVNLPLHLSTQAGVCNVWGAMEAKRKGFSRVILARETEISEISEISKIIETEVFVQGALCSSLSGHCLMSSFAGCNSANRGLCKQPCRKKYRVDGEAEYMISLADLSVGERVSELAAAGVSSFKIEGRMRSPEYVYAATSYYRAIMDGRAGDVSAMKRAYNRGEYTEGYAFGWNPSVRYPLANGHIGESVGTVTGSGKGESFVKSDYRPKKGDGFKVLRGGVDVGGTAVFREGNGGFYLKGNYPAGSDVRITAAKLAGKPRRIAVEADGEFEEGKPCRVTLKANGVSATAMGETVQTARTEPMTEERFAVLFGKTGDTPFELKSVKFRGKNGFLPSRACNEWRREAYNSLADKLAEKTAEKAPTERRAEYLDVPRLDMDGISGITVSETAVGGDIRVVFPSDYGDVDTVEKLAEKHGERYVLLYIPAFFNGRDEALIEKLLPYFDGIYANGRGAADFAAAHKIPYVAGLGMGAFSKEDVAALYADGASAAVLSNELSEAETKNILKEYPTVFVHVSGGIRLMEFLYCPYGGNCPRCRAENLETVTDDGGRKFYLRRYKTSRCRFELYNGSALSIPFSGNTLSEQIGLPDGYSEPATKGHWKRPLPSAIEIK